MKKQFLALARLLALVAFSQLTVFAADRIRFEVAIDPSLAPQPESGRLLIFFTSNTNAAEVIEPDFLNPTSVWLAAMEVHNLTPGKPVELDPDAFVFPAPFSTAPRGDYQVMALLDVDHSYTYDGMGPGDLYSAVSKSRGLNPKDTSSLRLTLTKPCRLETTTRPCLWS